MFGREEALAALERAGARYELAEHPAVFTVEEAHAAGVPFAPFGAKNLFLRDDKKRAYYLVTMPDGSRRAVVAVGRRVVVTRDDGRQARVHSSAKVTVFIDSPEAVLDEARREAEWSEGTRARYVLRLRRILEDGGPAAFGGTPGDEGDGDE